MNEGDGRQGGGFVRLQLERLEVALERRLVPPQLAVHVRHVVVDGFPGLQGDVGVAQAEALGRPREVPLGLVVVLGVVQDDRHLLQEDGVAGGQGAGALHEAAGDGGGPRHEVLPAEVHEGPVGALHHAGGVGVGRDGLVVLPLRGKGEAERHVGGDKVRVEGDGLGEVLEDQLVLGGGDVVAGDDVPGERGGGELVHEAVAEGEELVRPPGLHAAGRVEEEGVAVVRVAGEDVRG